jgi:hypothetical protein
MSTVNRFILFYFFAFLIKKKLEAGLILHSKTCFFPGNEGITIDKEGTITITTSEPPILQVCKSNTGKLWMVSAEKNKAIKQKETHKLFSLPSIPQTVKYLHASARYPVDATWINAIIVENFVTWPGLTVATVRMHFPESDETIKGHMKKQYQGIRSTKVKEVKPAEEAIPDLETHLDVPNNAKSRPIIAPWSANTLLNPRK